MEVADLQPAPGDDVRRIEARIDPCLIGLGRGTQGERQQQQGDVRGLFHTGSLRYHKPHAT